MVGSRSCGADIGQLPLKVLLQWLKTLEGDLEFVWSIEGCWVVADGDVEQAHSGHLVCAI